MDKYNLVSVVGGEYGLVAVKECLAYPLDQPVGDDPLSWDLSKSIEYLGLVVGIKHTRQEPVQPAQRHHSGR